ncbi:MetQ/NlpA family ABC transporter substrate-binding protein [Isobaculum melis]|uniref:Lipoprotein n=1 Tax=Isobaculum melis TaxID=142588 RepID=A0A1H9SWH6_9LACT|nr:MetQ/NlpA family ABC transporter substrate-binding protein [Isobaculum melis]SER89266.1 D-methionine transport system substrate-binding protein [Isobaculum melis]
MKKWTVGLVLATILVLFVGCGNSKKDDNTNKVKIGLVGQNNEVWDYVKEELKKDGIDLELVVFDDYNQPNAALAEGELDLNSFQHQSFLDSYNQDHGTKLVAIGKTYIAPLGIYSEKVKDISEIKEGAKIAIPNDTTNGGRAILLLQTAGLIKVDKDAGLMPTVNDITENKLNLKIEELDAAQTARALPDVTASIVNGNMAVDAGLNPLREAIYLEPIDETSDPYINMIVANEKDKDKEIFQKIIKAYQTKEAAKIIEETTNGSAMPAWEESK